MIGIWYTGPGGSVATYCALLSPRQRPKH